MSSYNDEHIAGGCETCAEAIRRGPQPFDGDLCHMDIRPDADRDRDDSKPVIQCPHLVVPGSRVPICIHHMERAAADYVRLVERTAPLN